MAEVNPYIVSYQCEDLQTSKCVLKTQEEWAFSAQDAKAQVEISLQPKLGQDPYFRVLKVEPKRET